MTPERLAEIERELTAGFALPNCDCLECRRIRDALDLIAHIRDLEAQLAAARERESQLVRAIEMLGVPVPLPKPELTAWLQSPAAESLREHVRRAIAEEYATATPPSPEVGA